MSGNLEQVEEYLGQTVRMLIGTPDYSNHVEHIKTSHPDKSYTSYKEFFCERQDTRYGGDGKGDMRCY